MKINILTPDVYNRIAAGEVVDRPYSVVKELVENAIDAGAKEITIEIESGGKKRIRVTDNGGGIGKDDLKAVYLPHATSKLKTADDLSAIFTLGFRGEAVASIASVSRMNITSKTAGNEGYSLTSEGGVLGEVEPAGSADGTCVTVDDLFYNTPARLKFLKSDTQEEGDVTNMVARFLLSRPEISFTYSVNGKVRYRSFGDGLQSALACVYGAGILQNCYEIEAEKHGVKLHGFIGNQNFSKPNRSYQSLFINGRYVVNQTVGAAVTNAYANYLMKRQYPFYVLFLDVPPEIVDVNVHPNKADVRFADNQIIYGCVYSVISAVLDGNSRALEYLVNMREQPEHAEQTEQAEQTVQTAPSAPAPVLEAEPVSEPEPVFSKAPPAPQMTFEAAKKELAFDLSPVGEAAPVTPYRKPEPFMLEVNAPKAKPQEDYFEQNRRELLEREKAMKQERIDPKNLTFKGELFRTYLIYEAGDCAYFIDQHAAHERLIYNRLKERCEKREVVSQPMLMPYVYTANGVEFAFLEKNFPVLRELGFDIGEFGGNSVKVSAVPVDLAGIDVEKFLGEVLSSMETLRAVKLADLIKDKLATMACKAAVKGGESLTEGEARALIEEMDGNMGLRCPHGRPACVKMKKSELEKLFKRTV